MPAGRRDFRESHGRQVGVKPAGGIRTAKDAIRYLVLVNETAGEDWLDPRWFRFGASSLLNDLLMQRTKMMTGRYSGPDYFTLDCSGLLLEGLEGGQAEGVPGRVGVDAAVIVWLEVVPRGTGSYRSRPGCVQVVDVEVQVHLRRRD